MVLRPHRVTRPTVHIRAPRPALVQASWGRAGPVCLDARVVRGGPRSRPRGPVSLTADLLLDAAQHWFLSTLKYQGSRNA